MKPKNLLKAAAAVFVAAAMGLAGVGSAMAEDVHVSDKDLQKEQTLTVTANEDISNRSLKAVPLAYYSFAQTDEAKQRITGFGLNDAGKAKAIDEAITAAGVKNEDNEAGYDTSNPMVWVVQNLLENDENNAGNLRDFLDKLKDKTAITEDEGTKFTPTQGNSTEQTASVDPGVYAVVDTTTSGRASIVMFNGTGINGITTLSNGAKTYTLGTVEYKVHDVTVSKKVTNVTGNGNHGNISADGKTVDAELGSTIDFEMNTQVPNWTGYDHYYFALNDTYSNGLSLDTGNAGSFSVTVTPKNGKAITLKQGTDYKVVIDNANHKFSVIFLDGQSSQAEDIIPNTAKLPVGAAMKITYSMTTVGGNNGSKPGSADTSTIEVEYSHNPNTWTDREKKTGSASTVKVYTGSTKILSVDSNGVPLAGTEFEVYKDGEKVPMIKDGNAYRVATKQDGSQDSYTVKSGSDGYITINGLDGEYTIKETKSAFDSTTILPSWTIKVAVNQTNGEYTTTIIKGDANKLVSALDHQAGSKVVNTHNLLDMPKTGATWLCIFGAVTVLFAGGAFLLLRRRA